MMDEGQDHRTPLDKLEEAAEAVIAKACIAEVDAEKEARRRSYEQGNRLGLLWVHGLVGFTAGIQMGLWGSSTNIETAVGVWTRLMMACLGTFGGALLIAGLARKPRSIPLEAAGLAVVGLWDLLMTIGLGYARYRQHEYAVIPLDRPIREGYVVAYPVTVYFGFLALICIHLFTLRRLRASDPDLGGKRGESS